MTGLAKVEKVVKSGRLVDEEGKRSVRIKIPVHL